MGIEPTSEAWEAIVSSVLNPHFCVLHRECTQLQTVQRECPLSPCHIKMIDPQNLKVAESVSHT